VSLGRGRRSQTVAAGKEHRGRPIASIQGMQHDETSILTPIALATRFCFKMLEPPNASAQVCPPIVWNVIVHRV
jgi:hypothetical protein